MTSTYKSSTIKAMKIAHRLRKLVGGLNCQKRTAINKAKKAIVIIDKFINKVDRTAEPSPAPAVLC